MMQFKRIIIKPKTQRITDGLDVQQRKKREVKDVAEGFGLRNCKNAVTTEMEWGGEKLIYPYSAQIQTKILGLWQRCYASQVLTSLFRFWWRMTRFTLPPGYYYFNSKVKTGAGREEMTIETQLLSCKILSFLDWQYGTQDKVDPMFPSLRMPCFI